jgi:hypothetical protein
VAAKWWKRENSLPDCEETPYLVTESECENSNVAERQVLAQTKEFEQHESVEPNHNGRYDGLYEL